MKATDALVADLSLSDRRVLLCWFASQAKQNGLSRAFARFCFALAEDLAEAELESLADAERMETDGSPFRTADDNI